MAPVPPSSNERQIDAIEFDPSRSIQSTDSRDTQRSLLDDDVSFMSEVARGILQKDRRRMRGEVTRIASFACAVLSW